MGADSRLVYEVWERLIRDEGLYQSLADGTHTEAAAKRGLSAEQSAVLAEFAAAPGTRWNVENLRFRSALETCATVESYLPLTIKLLTRGDPDWLQDICFEYLAHHHWQVLGHMRLGECQRFGQYVRERVMKRRITPPGLDAALTFELGVVEVLKMTAAIAPEAWPRPDQSPLADDTLAAAQPRRSPAQRVIELPIDIRAWVASGKPDPNAIVARPIAFLVHVPSLREIHKIKVVGEGARELLGRCSGERTTAVIAAQLEEEFDLGRDDVFRLVAQWVTERILMV